MGGRGDNFNVCMCMYAFVGMHVFMYVGVYVCMCVCMYVYACVCVCMCVCMYVYACVYVCMCVCMYIYACVCVCMCVCMYNFSGVHDVEVECAEQVGKEVTITEAKFCDEAKEHVKPPRKCKDLPPCFKVNVHHGDCDTPCGEFLQ